MAKERKELVWKKRRRLETTPIAKHWIRETQCGRYRVVQSVPIIGVEVTPVQYIACVLQFSDSEGAFWDILSKHRLEGPAQTACINHARGPHPLKGKKRKKEST